QLALLAVGLTGHKGDFPLLESFYDNKHPTPFWSRRLRNAAESALARLGSETHLKNIEGELKNPVPPVLNRKIAQTINEAIDKAAFSNNPRFIPFLCGHLKDPDLVQESDAIMEPPSSVAANALNQLINQ